MLKWGSLRLAPFTRWQVTGSIQDRSRIGQVKTIPPAHCCFNDAAVMDNDELTVSDLIMLLVKEFEEEIATYSERMIARAHNELGWTFTTMRYCQAICDANKL